MHRLSLSTAWMSGRAIWLVSTLAWGVMGCGPSSDHDTGSPDGGEGQGNQSAAAACGAVFDAVTTGTCATPGQPVDFVAHERARYILACTGNLALPGYGYATAQIQACVTALDAAPGLYCSLSSPTSPASIAAEKAIVAACSLGGTAAPGVPCEQGTQCASGNCESPAVPGYGATGCGTCVAAIPVGQSCAGTGATCDRTANCDYSAATPVCRAVTPGDAGAPCDDNYETCDVGLGCSPTTKVCGTPGGLGAACAESIDCAAPLVCRGTPLTCQAQGQLGATCNEDSECASSLCSPGTGQCVTPSWIAPGQPCSASDRCESGSCVFTAGVGTCPTVIADGQPCGTSDTAVCDLQADCIGGVCKLPGTHGCQ